MYFYFWALICIAFPAFLTIRIMFFGWREPHGSRIEFPAFRILYSVFLFQFSLCMCVTGKTHIVNETWECLFYAFEQKMYFFNNHRKFIPSQSWYYLNHFAGWHLCVCVWYHVLQWTEVCLKRLHLQESIFCGGITPIHRFISHGLPNGNAWYKLF
jgi:hypothetical protein